MAMTEEQKKARAEAREKKEREEIASVVSGSRPGMGSYRRSLRSNDEIEKRFSVMLSPIEHLSISVILKNPKNPYAPLEPEELRELSKDIARKGVLIPLIARPDCTLVCGHNRLDAALQAGLSTVPVQTITHPKRITPELELEIMKSENDRRRGGGWTKAKKKEFIKQHFGDEIEKTGHGGKRTGAGKKGKSANQASLKLEKKSEGLARKIEERSRGRIAKGTADRLVSELRKESGAKRSPAHSSGTPKRREAKVMDGFLASLQATERRVMFESYELRKQAAKELRKAAGRLLVKK